MAAISLARESTASISASIGRMGDTPARSAAAESMQVP
jgi:hypothetical protein